MQIPNISSKVLRLDPKTLSYQLKRLKKPSASTVAGTGVSQAYADDTPVKKSKGGRKRALQRKYSAAPFLSEEDRKNLQADLLEQLKVHPKGTTAEIIPQRDVQEKLRRVLEGNVEQTRGGLLGGVGMGAVAGGMGAITTGLAKGLEKAPSGMAMAIPGALKGYRLGKKIVRNKQIKGILDDTYGEELAPTKEAALEPGFEEVLRQLRQEKIQGTLRREDVKQALRDLQEGRRYEFKTQQYPLSSVEKQVLHRELGDTLYTAPKQQIGGKQSILRRLVRKHPKSALVAGGLSALGALGLTAAEVQRVRNQRKWSEMEAE